MRNFAEPAAQAPELSFAGAAPSPQTLPNQGVCESKHSTRSTPLLDTPHMVWRARTFAHLANVSCRVRQLRGWDLESHNPGRCRLAQHVVVGDFRQSRSQRHSYRLGSHLRCECHQGACVCAVNFFCERRKATLAKQAQPRAAELALEKLARQEGESTYSGDTSSTSIQPSCELGNKSSGHLFSHRLSQRPRNTRRYKHGLRKQRTRASAKHHPASGWRWVGNTPPKLWLLLCTLRRSECDCGPCHKTAWMRWSVHRPQTLPKSPNQTRPGCHLLHTNRVQL